MLLFLQLGFEVVSVHLACTNIFPECLWIVLRAWLLDVHGVPKVYEVDFLYGIVLGNVGVFLAELGFLVSRLESSLIKMVLVAVCQKLRTVLIVI